LYRTALCLSFFQMGGRHRSTSFQRTDAKEGNCERVSKKSATTRFSILGRRRHYQGIARPSALRPTLTMSTFVKISHLGFIARQCIGPTIQPLCLPNSVNARMQLSLSYWSSLHRELCKAARG